MAEIRLTRGLVAIVDDADLPLLANRRWQARRRPGNQGWYAHSSTHRHGKHIGVFMHDFLLGQRGVDHINRNGLDNRRQNLRHATQSQNLANSGPRGGTSRFKGVHWDKWTRSSRRWRALIMKDGRTRHLGRFTTEVEAARAYNEAALTLFGEYARLNDIEGAS